MTVSTSESIFCCASATQVNNGPSNKPHNNPNRPIHDAILKSFLAFADRRQRSSALLALIQGLSYPSDSLPLSPPLTPPTSTSILAPPTPIPTPKSAPAPVFALEALQNNPLNQSPPYVIHITARHDFGPVFSHRYFMCPNNLEQDWTEVGLVQWFARGEAFKMKAEKWDFKCMEDNKFYRLTLRPNLEMRGQGVGVES